MKNIKFLIILFLCKSVICNAKSESYELNSESLVDLSQGVWENKEKDSSLTITIYKINGKFVGNFCSIVRNGGKIDCAENNNFINMYENSRDDGILTMKINGNYDSDSIGYVKLSLNKSLLNWSFKNEKGEFFVPFKKDLKKSNNKVVVISNKAIVYKNPKYTISNDYFIIGDIVNINNINHDKNWIDIFYGKNKKGWLKMTDVK